MNGGSAFTLSSMCYNRLSKPIPNWSKPSKAGPRSGEIFSKEKAWISLDWLVRNEPFQDVALTP
jgi:hypothetical protein